MRFTEVITGDVVVLTAREPRLDARNAPQLKAAIAAAVERGHAWIALDLSEVDFVDSSALGAIVSGLKLLGRKGDLVISGAREPVAALFRLTRMDKVFRMFPSVDEACQGLSARA